MRYTVTLDGHSYEIDVADDGLTVDGEPLEATLLPIDGTPVHALRIAAASHRVVAGRDGDGCWRLDVDGRPARVEVVDERTRRLREMTRASAGSGGPRPVKAPMPGLVVQVDVAEDDEVAEGQGVVIVEAMKMENELRAEVAARVTRVLVAAGDTVDKDQVLVEFASLDGEDPE